MSESYEYDGGRFSYGNSCESGEFCSLTTILVVVVIAFFLIGGIIVGIKEKGFLKGISKSGLFAILLYLGVIYLMVIMVSALDEIFGKPYSFAPFLIFFGLLHLWGRSGKKTKQKEHQLTIKEKQNAPKIQNEVTQDQRNKNIDYDIPPSWRKPK